MTEAKEQEQKLSQEELKLDKFKAALSGLKEQVGSLEEFSAIEERLKAAFMKDVKEELELSEEESNKLWEQAKKTLTTNDKWKEILKEKVAESAEKTALDAYVENVENYDAIKAAIERKGGEGMIKQFIGFLREKWDNSKWAKKYGIKWGAITAWFGKMFIEYANAGKKKLGAEKEKGFVLSSAWRDPFYNQLKNIGEWLSGEEKKEEKPKEETAQKAAESKKYAKEVKEMESLFALHNLKFKKFSNADYERVLKSKKFSNDPKQFKKMAEENLVPKMVEFTKKLGDHPRKSLRKEFQFTINDLLISPDNWELATKVIEGNHKKYEIQNLARLNPKKLRKFMDAVRIGGYEIEEYEI